MGPITPDDLRFNRFGLSQQESRVLALAMAGRIDKQIATEIGISLGTVRVYWKRIRQKVGGTRSEVIAQLARTSLKVDFDGAQKKADELEKELDTLRSRERELQAYELAFESLPTPMAILDAPLGRVIKANPAFAQMHGYSAEELQGLPIAALSVDAARGYETAARKASGAGKAHEANSQRRRKDGTTFAARTALTGKDQNWVLTVIPEK